MWEKWSLYREKVGRVEGKNLNFLQKVEGMCGAWIHTPQTCVAYGSIRHKHVWGSCGVWIHTPQRKPMRHKKFKFKFVCHVCVKFVTHKHVHAPQRKVCVTFGEVIRDKQSWFCHSYPMRHIPHVTSLLFSCSDVTSPKSWFWEESTVFMPMLLAFEYKNFLPSYSTQRWVIVVTEIKP